MKGAGVKTVHPFAAGASVGASVAAGRSVAVASVAVGTGAASVAVGSAVGAGETFAWQAVVSRAAAVAAMRAVVIFFMQHQSSLCGGGVVPRAFCTEDYMPHAFGLCAFRVRAARREQRFSHAHAVHRGGQYAARVTRAFPAGIQPDEPRLAIFAAQDAQRG